MRAELRTRRRAARPELSALVQLGLAGGALAGTAIALFAAGPEPRWPFMLFAAVGVEYLAAGLFAWTRRPSNGTGALLSLCGFGLLAAAIANTGIASLYVVGNLAAELPIGVLLHLLLAFPSGRLPDAWSRWLVLAGYVITVVLHAPQVLFAGDPLLPAAFDLGAHPDLVLLTRWTQSLAGALVIALTAWVLLRRLRRADADRRRGLAAVYAYGAFTIVFLVLSANVVRPLLRLDPLELFEVQIIAFAGVPLAFVAGVLRGGFARTSEIDQLAAWLGAADPGRPGLRRALRATLGDPSLDLLFWLPEQQRYVDERGQESPHPAPGTGRALVDVETATGRVGAITYDANLLADPGFVRGAGRVVALALERERLTIELLASHDALVESRSRIVESADRERRRIARDLHDGLQARLVVLALRAGRIAARVEPHDGLGAEAVQLRTDLEGAITELRRLVHGVLPALLIQRGLAATVEELLDQTPIRSRLEVTEDVERVPPQVETAGYFFVAEAVGNAAKHANAHEVCVTLAHTGDVLRIEVADDGVGGARLEGGSGLRGLCDRVEAVGGRLELHSPIGRGTRLSAELPCGS